MRDKARTLVVFPSSRFTPHWSSHGTGPKEMRLLKGVTILPSPFTPTIFTCHQSAPESGDITSSAAGKSLVCISPKFAHIGLPVERPHNCQTSGSGPGNCNVHSALLTRVN